MERVIILIPVYRPELPAIEWFSLRHSLSRLQPGRHVAFVAPRTLDTSAYERAWPGAGVVRFEDDCFASIQGYNRLLLSAAFYERFAATHSHMLILQTDAILLRDDLDHWLDLPYDYVGAPWPGGVEILVNLDQFNGPLSKRVKAHVGNGGLSLRNNRACADLLAEFPQALDYFLRTGSSEDLYFSLLGGVSARFVMPNEMVAARFALELKPEHYQQQLRDQTPMGGHAWWKYNPDYWLDRLGAAADEIRHVVVPVAPSGGQVALLQHS